MAVFSFVALTKEGKKIEGRKEVPDKDTLVDQLMGQGLTIISVSEDLGANLSKLLKMDIGGIPLNDKVLLAKQLSTMITAGIPVIQAIDILRQQSEKATLREKLDIVYKGIESGNALSASFDKAGGIFSEVQINLIAAGEKSGNLNEMLIQVAIDMEKSKNLRGKIVGALIYPAVILAVLVLIMAVMLIFMIPQVKDLYQSLGQNQLPMVTRILVKIGEAFSNPFTLLIIIVVLIALVFTYRYYNSQPETKIILDKFKLKIPVFGNLISKVQLVQFARTVSMLIRSGVPIIEAIDVTQRALGSEVYKKVLRGARDELTKGSPLSLAIAKNNINDAFPPMLIKIIATGEEAGKVEKVLEDMSNYYEEEVNQISANLTKLMEPFILVVVGGMVAFLAIAIYYPIYNVGKFFS